MNPVTNFIVFCLESYKQAHHLTGKEVINLFNEHNIFEYLNSFYDVLHTTGESYIVQDIDGYIRARSN